MVNMVYTLDMINLATIIVLLQVALGLLANPAVQTNPEVKAQALTFATQAISLATQALAQPATTTLGAVGTSTDDGGIIITPIPVPTPTPEPAPIVLASCSLSAVTSTTPGAERPASTISWTSQNLASNVTGQLYVVNGQSGGEPTYQYLQNVYGPSGSVGRFVGTQFKANFEGTVCFATTR